jgi:hypothetical protein
MVRPGRDRLSVTVEVDEIFIGGERPGKRGRGAEGKASLVHVLGAGPVTHYASEFADWMCSPLAPLANVSRVDSQLGDWVVSLGVDVGE